MPWWVRSLFPNGIGRRRAALRNVYFYAAGGTLLGVSFEAAASFPGSELHPYRWWGLAYFAVAGLALFGEWRAIRWVDRAKRWPA